jgi:hypothetical protein
MNLTKVNDAGKMVSVANSAVRMGTLGAIVGGSVSAVGNVYKLTKGEVDSAEAITNVTKETVGTGLAAAAGAAATTLLGLSGLWGIFGFVLVASASKGFIESTLESKKKQPT